MENIKITTSELDIKTKIYSFGNLTSIINPNGISPGGNTISLHSKSGLYTIKSYNKSSYDVVYLEINKEGKIINAHTESEGVLPTFFKATDQSVWQTITSTKIDGIKEIVLPFNNRERINKVKTSREFPGKFIGTIDNQVLFHDSDSFERDKPDRLCKLFFDKNHLYKKRKIIKLKLPSSNQVYCTKNGEIHLLSYLFDEKELIHRQIDVDGNELNKRSINLHVHHFGIINLSFESPSILVTTMDCKAFLIIVNSQGEITSTELFEYGGDDYFYNVWDPIDLGGDNYLIKFNHSGGNGWAVLNSEGLLELFIADKEKFINPMSGETIDFGLKNPVLGNAIGFFENKYSLSAYNSYSGANDRPTEFVILARTITTKK